INVPAGDVPLLHQDLGDPALDRGVRDRDRVVVRVVRVPNPGKHVRDRVSHRHRPSPALGVPAALRAERGTAWGFVMGYSPTTFRDAGELARVRHLPDADAAEPECAVDRTRASAALATGVTADLELGLPRGLVDQGCLRHTVRTP